MRGELKVGAKDSFNVKVEVDGSVSGVGGVQIDKLFIKVVETRYSFMVMYSKVISRRLFLAMVFPMSVIHMV